MPVSEEIKETLGFDPENPDLQKLLLEAVPPLGIEYCSELFNRCGYTLSGISEGWQWNSEISVTDAEAWQMIAISALYWCHKYEGWYKEAQERLQVRSKILDVNH